MFEKKERDEDKLLRCQINYKVVRDKLFITYLVFFCHLFANRINIYLINYLSIPSCNVIPNCHSTLCNFQTKINL